MKNRVVFIVIFKTGLKFHENGIQINRHSTSEKCSKAGFFISWYFSFDYMSENLAPRFLQEIVKLYWHRSPIGFLLPISVHLKPSQYLTWADFVAARISKYINSTISIAQHNNKQYNSIHHWVPGPGKLVMCSTIQEFIPRSK